MASTERPRWAHPTAVRTLLAASAVTAVGDQVAGVALALGAHQRGGSGLAVSALLIASLLPFVVLAPLAGWVVDRVEATRILTACGLVGAYVSAGIALSDDVVVWVGGVAVLASASAFAQPALLTLLPHAAGRDAGRRALALAAVASRSSAVTGPLVAAALVAVGGVRTALLVDALSYLALVLGLRLAGVRRPARRQPVDAGSGGVGAGLRALTGDPVLRLVVGVLVAAITFVGISYVAVFFFVQDSLGAGDAGVAAVLSAYGAGMTIGCWGAGRFPVRGLAPAAVAAPAVMGLGLLAPVVVPLLGVAVAGFAAAGLAAGTALTAMRGLVHERVAEHLLGRVWAAESALGVCGELVALASAGVIVTVLGPDAAMLLCGAGTLVPATVGLVLLRRAQRAHTRTAVTPGAATGPTVRVVAEPAVPAGPVPVPVPRAPRPADASTVRHPAALT